VCVCVCVRESESACAHTCARAREYLCVCSDVCVCACACHVRIRTLCVGYIYAMAECHSNKNDNTCVQGTHRFNHMCRRRVNHSIVVLLTYMPHAEDDSLVLLSAAQVDHWVAATHTGSPASNAKEQQKESTPSMSTLKFNGAAIVLLSAFMSYACAVSGTRGASALKTSLHMMFGNGTLCLVGSWVFNDYSWTDRLWSVTPFFYTLYFAYDSQWDMRCSLMAAFTFLWSARLTYNFARKGGYKIGEQVRYLVSRLPGLLRQELRLLATIGGSLGARLHPKVPRATHFGMPLYGIFVYSHC